MTEIDGSRRRLLPLLPGFRHGSRSHVTCFYKCGNACDAAVPNRTDNPTFAEVVNTAVSRRALLQAAGVSTLVVAAGSVGMPTAEAEEAAATAAADRGGALTFRPVQPNVLDELVVAEGYAYGVVMRWGDPVEPGAPVFHIDRQSPEAQAKQFGYNCDYIGLLPLPGNGDRGLLVVNHEYTDEQLMFSGVESEEAPTTDRQKRISLMAHGISVVQIQRDARTGNWRPTTARNRNRRVTAYTRIELTGPAAGSQYLKTKADPTGRFVLGTLNNCAGGMTPWGTTLHGEENFNQYFGASATVT